MFHSLTHTLRLNIHQINGIVSNLFPINCYNKMIWHLASLNHVIACVHIFNCEWRAEEIQTRRLFHTTTTFHNSHQHSVITETDLIHNSALNYYNKSSGVNRHFWNQIWHLYPQIMGNSGLVVKAYRKENRRKYFWFAVLNWYKIGMTR